MKAKSALKALNKVYRKSNKTQKAKVLFQIIQIKNDNRTLSNYKRPLYLEIKKFIKYYIESNDKQDFGYDKIDIEKFKRVIEVASNYKEKYELCLYTLRLMNINALEVEISNFKSYKDDCKTSLLKSDKGWLKRNVNLLLHLSSCSLKTIILILAAIFVISYFLFLPAYHQNFEVFRIDYQPYAENFYLNHFLNLISLSLGMENEKIIEPLNWVGVLILSLLRITYLLIIINYLYQKALDIIYAK